MVKMIAIGWYLDNEQVVNGISWKLANRHNLDYIAVNRNTSEEEIGLIIKEFVRRTFDYEEPKSINNVEEAFIRILKKDTLILPGGIAVINSNKSIFPSCCCGLEEWREWEDIFETGYAPWMGHTPWPGIEILNDRFRIWSGSYDEDEKDQEPEGYEEIYIDLSFDEYKQNLIMLHQDLIDFLNVLEIWMNNISRSFTDQIIDLVDRKFNIKKDYRKNKSA